MPEIDLRDEPEGRASLGMLTRCPVCHAAELQAVRDGDSVNFLCAHCERCWHVELNWIMRVDPATCGGCSHREPCTARFAADQADSGAPVA